MENTQTFYLKILSLTLVVSLAITTILGSILFTNKKSFIHAEERISRIELENLVTKIISRHSECNKSLVGLEIPKINEFTNMDSLSYSNGKIALKSNTNASSLYIEQIRLKNIDTNTTNSKVLVEVSIPLKSQKNILSELETISLKMEVLKDSAGRVAACKN